MTRRRRMRAALRGGLAVLLGCAAAALVSCGSSGKGLIPVAQAEPLQADFEEVSRAAAAGNGNCSATNAALEKTARDFHNLPSSVNSGLLARLREGVEALHSQAIAQCSQVSTNTTPTTATTQTATTPTTPTQTTTTPTTPTQTETTTTPSTTAPPPPGGGTEPPSEGNGDGGGGIGNGGVPPGQEGKEGK